MQFSFRAKLMAIVLTATLALAGVLVLRVWLAVEQTTTLDHVEGRLIPKLELGPRLESQFEHLRQAMQDAVAAQDAAALDDTIRLRNEMNATISSAGAALTPADAALLRHAVTAYHDAAYGTSRRLIRGESGESVVDAIASMQVQQRSTEALIARAARLDRKELAGGFQSVRDGIARGVRYGLGIGAVSLVVVLALSFWLGSGVLRTLRDMSSGMSRFATGAFDEPIPITTNDELGKVAQEANQMAESLQAIAWQQEGLAELSAELRNELEPKEVAKRAVTFFCRRLEAVCGTLFTNDGKGTLVPAATFAPDALPDKKDRSFRLGEGLPGEAALGKDLFVVQDPPEHYFTVRSGSGEAAPKTLLFLPLTRGAEPVGLLELGLFEPSNEAIEELLTSAREMVTIGLEVSLSRATLRDLLEESQRQTELLAAQEEELRVTNRELSSQQEELRRANSELEDQRQVLSRKNLELEQTRAGLVEKADELARMSSYKSQFLANMSHELRTPLNSMLLLSHLLADNESKNLTTKQVEFAKTIHAAGKDLLGLINQVLDLAKIEAGRQEVELDEVPLSELLDNARRLFQESAENKGLSFRIEVEPGLPESIVTDRQRLDRILVNLLGNALKFTEKGEVSLRVHRPKEKVPVKNGELLPESTFAFAVSDTGIGIAPAAQERIFAPFEQADARADRRYSGTGLGLAIARESSQLIGGDLVLESREGQGSTFTCYVPDGPRVAKPRPAEPIRLADRPVRSDDRKSLGPSEPYLLVVEDDPTFAEQLVDLIHARRFKAVVATTGKQALALAKETAPHGIIMDVKLPDIDGWTVMERLRHDPQTRAIPVHFISGVDAPDRALALGAVGYLTKPATRDELMRVVRTLSRPLAEQGNKVLVVEDNVSEGDSVVQLVASAGLEAQRVASAAAAFEALLAGGFGCVILDLGLPDMDGLGLLEALRNRPEVGTPPVVVHTGRSLTREETRRIEAYAEAVVLKDGNSAERLLDEVRLFLQHVKDEAPRALGTTAARLLPEVSLEGARILIADDDMRTVYALSALLRGRGADVLVAETGKEALEVLAENPGVHLVLMDMMMPELDGYEALRRLRADKRLAHLPAIALTAKAMKDERERCLQAGASEYLTKPVDTGRLFETLERFLHKKAAQ